MYSASWSSIHILRQLLSLNLGLNDSSWSGWPFCSLPPSNWDYRRAPSSSSLVCSEDLNSSYTCEASTFVTPFICWTISPALCPPLCARKFWAMTCSIYDSHDFLVLQLPPPHPQWRILFWPDIWGSWRQAMALQENLTGVSYCRTVAQKCVKLLKL